MKFLKAFNDYLFSDRFNMFDLISFSVLLTLSYHYREPLLMLLMFPFVLISAFLNMKLDETHE
jgi:hypothetical protein